MNRTVLRAGACPSGNHGQVCPPTRAWHGLLCRLGSEPTRQPSSAIPAQPSPGSAAAHRSRSGCAASSLNSALNIRTISALSLFTMQPCSAHQWGRRKAGSHGRVGWEGQAVRRRRHAQEQGEAAAAAGHPCRACSAQRSAAGACTGAGAAPHASTHPPAPRARLLLVPQHRHRVFAKGVASLLVQVADELGAVHCTASTWSTWAALDGESQKWRCVEPSIGQQRCARHPQSTAQPLCSPSLTNPAPPVSGMQPSQLNEPWPVGLDSGASPGAANAQPACSSWPGRVCCHVGCVTDSPITSVRPCSTVQQVKVASSLAAGSGGSQQHDTMAALPHSCTHGVASWHGQEARLHVEQRHAAAGPGAR